MRRPEKPRREALGREHKGPCGARQPREGLGGVCGQATGRPGALQGRRHGADAGRWEGSWGPGAWSRGRHSQPCRSGRSRRQHWCFTIRPRWSSQHQQRRLAGRTHQLMLHPRCLCTCPAAIGKTRSARHTQHGRGVRKAKGQAVRSSTSTQPPEETGRVTSGSSEESTPPRPPAQKSGACWFTAGACQRRTLRRAALKRVDGLASLKFTGRR